jgi:pimeloyl-ACP methyl ester carboxylesterase
LNTSNAFCSAVFENQFIRFQYAVSGSGLKPFLFFTGFAENPIHYKRFLKYLPADYFLIVVKTPIAFKLPACELELAIVELLKHHNLPLNICLGGFSFGNWVATSLLFAKKINIRACVFVAAPSTFNFQLYQALNQHKWLNFVSKKLVNSGFIYHTFTRFTGLFMNVRINSMLKKLDFKADLNCYLNTPVTSHSLPAILIRANNLAIPCLLLKSNQDPITPSDSFYLLAQKHIQKVEIIRVNSKQHSAFVEELMKILSAFLADL